MKNEDNLKKQLEDAQKQVQFLKSQLKRHDHKKSKNKQKKKYDNASRVKDILTEFCKSESYQVFADIFDIKLSHSDDQIMIVCNDYEHKLSYVVQVELDDHPNEMIIEYLEDHIKGRLLIFLDTIYNEMFKYLKDVEVSFDPLVNGEIVLFLQSIVRKTSFTTKSTFETNGQKFSVGREIIATDDNKPFEMGSAVELTRFKFDKHLAQNAHDYIMNNLQTIFDVHAHLILDAELQLED